MALVEKLYDYKLRAGDAVSPPVLLTPVVGGTPGTTEYKYCATFKTIVGETTPTAEMTVSTGPATISPVNYIRLNVSNIPAAATHVRYYKYDSGAWKLLGEVTKAVGLLDDIGQTLSGDEIAPDENTSGRPAWRALLFNHGRYLQRQELIDLQWILLRGVRDLGDTLHKNGDIVSGCAESFVSGTTWAFTAGKIYLDGQIVDVPSGTVTLVGTGTEKAGITVTPTIVTHNTDAVMRNQDELVDLDYAQSGADRLVYTFAWGVDQDGQLDICEFLDNAPKVKTLPLERTILDRTLARRTNDVNGSFVVRPFTVAIEDHPTDTAKLRAKVGPGKCYVEGFEIETASAVFLDIDKARDVMARNNSGTDPYSCIGGTATGTATENFDVDGLAVKLKVGSGNSHTVTLSGNGQTAAQVASQISGSVNAYPSSESDDLVTCAGVSGKVQIVARNGYSLEIEAVASDAYTALGFTVGTYTPTGTRIYQINDDYVKEVTDMSYNVIAVEAKTHNGATHKDQLSNSGVREIIGASDALVDCHDGKFDYHYGVDFTRDGDYIDFTLGGSEPASGAVYYVKYRYAHNAVKGSRELVRVIDAQVVKGAEDGADNIVFTGFTSAEKVIDGSPVTGLSGSASDVVRIVRINNSAGQSTSQYDTYSLVKNSDALTHATSQISWADAGAQGVTPSGQPTTGATYYITFEYWKHSVEGDVVVADSYDMYEEIELAPNGTWYLRDCVDFRTGGNHPMDDDDITFDYEFYLARIDKLAIDTDGTWNVVKGAPAITPPMPPDQAGRLTAHVLRVMPYTYNVNWIGVQSIQCVRTTMMGINQLRDRIERMEYFNRLNLLEKSIAESDAAIGSQGIFTDPLTGWNRVSTGFDKGGVAHSAAIDNIEKCVRLPVSRTAKTLVPDLGESTHIREYHNSVMLDFEPELVLSQPRASTTINVNPDDLVTLSWLNGRMTIQPAVDFFMDETQAPALNADFDQNLSGLLNGIGERLDTQWGDWSVWPPGVTLNNMWRTGRTLVQNQITPNNINNITYSVYNYLGNEINDPWYGQWQYGERTGTDLAFTPNSEIVDLGDRVVDMSLAPMMRTKTDDGSPFEITIAAWNLRPNSCHGVSIDGVPCDFTATGSSSQGLETLNGKTTILTDAAGELTGKFTMPSGIPIGTRQIKVEYTTEQVSEATATFTSSGFMKKTQHTTLGLAGAQSQIVSQFESFGRYPTNRPCYYDPVAQTFIVDRYMYLCGVGVYFATKSLTNKVTCEIRRTLNGFPTRDILATTTLDPGDVNVSDDASAETVFYFENVLGYDPAEYCVVLNTNCTDYTVWISELGGVDVTTGQAIAVQPHGGVLFHSPNASTWEPMTKHDLKFNLYKSNFENDCQLVFNNITGVEASMLVSYFDQFVAPNTVALWWYSTDNGGSWHAFDPDINTELDNSFTSLKLRVDVTSLGGSYQIVHKNAGILLQLNQEEADYIGNMIEFEDDTAYPNEAVIRMDLVTDGVNGSGTRTVRPMLSVDDGDNWFEITPPAGYVAINKGDPWYEWEFRTPSATTVTGATNATPIVITSADHGFTDGAVVDITGVVGNTAANGTWRVASAADDTFALTDPDTGDDIAGNGAYVSGGTIALTEFTSARLRIHLATTNTALTPKCRGISLTCNRTE